ncbi:MAG TPA: hypothetical protein VLE53_01575 [Gemmatimonadaceae bacterium]|nr:hypothetical protein [Gemmatimonadaceae bacterium]
MMIHDRDNEYHDPFAPGSLVSTLRLWQALLAGEHAKIPQYVSFALQCTGEARANRLASGLRRRMACKTTIVSRVGESGQDLWQVVGVTYRQMQSLENLEHVSSWLRAAAVSYQVELVRMSLVGNVS